MTDPRILNLQTAAYDLTLHAERLLNRCRDGEEIEGIDWNNDPKNRVVTEAINRARHAIDTLTHPFKDAGDSMSIDCITCGTTQRVPRPPEGTEAVHYCECGASYSFEVTRGTP